MVKTVIGVMGPGAGALPEDCQNALLLGRRIAEAGWVLLTGGRGEGVMDAASRGAQEAGGLVVGVLPGGDRTAMSEAVDISIVTGMGHGRNVINILSSAVVIACGMGLGTASEVSLALKTGKPVILLSSSDAAYRFFHPLVAEDGGTVADERLYQRPLQWVSEVEGAIALVHDLLQSSTNIG